MVRRSVAEAAAAMAGAVEPGDDPAAAAVTFTGAAIDSRRVRGGELFFALAGARTDGHRHVAGALAAGAAAAVIGRPAEPAPPERAVLVRVADPFAALHDLTRAVRATVPERLVAITGSAGKTTTKDLLAAMLGRRFRVARSPGNLNNLYGFPVALLGIPDDTEWMVAEMGMSEPGELGRISRLGRPDVAVFTNVRPVHLEFFADLGAIAAAKEELLAGLAPGGLVVANAGDPEVAAIARRFLASGGGGGAGGRVVWYGRDGAAHHAGVPLDVAACDVAAAPAGEVGSRFVLRAGEQRQPVALPLHGGYNVDNCLAAAAAAWALGVPLGEIAAAAAAAAPAEHRGVVHHLAGGGRLVDDAYNSNPDALARALEGAAALAAGGRRWAVLGDMLELGPEAPRFHREAGAAAARLGFSPVVGVGELARELVAGADTAAGTETAWFATAAAAAEWAAGRLAELAEMAELAEVGSTGVVLVKGSRGVGLETVVARLLAVGAAAGEEAS